MKHTIYDKRNLTMLADFYELTMMNGYFENGTGGKEVVFDLFYRKNPDNGGYVIATGMEQVKEYIEGLHFTEEDIEYLRGKGMFHEDFLNYLKNFEFTGNIYAVPEGTVVYPNEPIIQVEAPVIQAQLIETMLLLLVNHQSLIATKASRIKNVAGDKLVMEFGARRAHSADAANYGARACYIGGADATATVSADQYFGVPAIGTMAHSWIQLHNTEYEAFENYAKAYPDNCSILIDTYDVMHSGLPNAIKLHKEYLQPRGYELKGVRIDSGDLAYLSKKCRKVLDAEGMQNTKIIVSNSIDEYLIDSLNHQGACIDSYGIGERMITAKSDPVFGGVYKLAAVKDDTTGEYVPRIKISENVEKITNPGFKQIYRFYNEEGYSFCDVLALRDEEPYKEGMETEVFDPNLRTVYKLHPAKVRPLLEPMFLKGKLVKSVYNTEQARENAKKELKAVWDEEKRMYNPHTHWVDLSKELTKVKLELLKKKV